MKRKLSLALAAVMLLTSVITTPVSANEADTGVTAESIGTADKIVATYDLPSYADYLEDAADYSEATAEVVVDAISTEDIYVPQTEKDEDSITIEKKESYKDEDGTVKNGVLVCKGEGGTVAYTVNVPTAGLYSIKFSYCALEKRNNPISLGLTIDGEYLFDGMQEFELPRLFVDDEKGIRVDGLGNEFSASQTEKFKYQECYFKDPVGLEDKPFTVALDAGEHTFVIEVVAEELVLDCFTLTKPVTYNSYKAVSSDEIANTAKSEEIKIEGEDADYKSTYSLVAQYDQTDATVSSATGSSPYLTRINYIGNSNWASPGSRLTWNFEVKESGYYKVAFRYQQSLVLNGSSYRKLYIDGEVPFEEAANIKFDYDLDWQMMEFSDSEGNPYYIYLEEGTHQLAMEVCLGDLSTIVRDLKNVIYDVGVLYQEIVKITGETPDYNRDYDLHNQIPNFLEKLEEYRDELNRIAAESERLAGKAGGSNASSMRQLSTALNEMIENKYTAHQYKSLYYSNYTSVSALVYSMMEMGLNIDYIMVVSPDVNPQNPEVSFFESLNFGFQRFLASFSADYNNVSGVSEYEESITIWANWGRDQIRVLNNLIQSNFTEEKQMGVNLKMSNASYVQAVLSGKGPDCSLHMARSEPVNLALRGAMYDLTEFDDEYLENNPQYKKMGMKTYDQVMERFYLSDDATLPFTFQNGDDIGVYALPDTLNFYMMFYRTDIFQEMGLEVPTTWDEYIQVASILYRNNLQASLPYTQITTAAMVNAGVGSLSIYPTLIMQMGGTVYKSDRTGTALADPIGIKAFEFWTDFYTEYKFPVTADFFNRFRVGTMPLGIQNYTMYVNLSLAAPEITGKWKMVPIPGFEDEDGNINNVQAGSGTGCGILSVANNPAGGWMFLDWWTSAETQLEYSNNCESILGVAGRVPTANPEALKMMGWDKDSVDALLSQWSMIQEVPEIPGSYYTARSIDQAYWNVVNNSQNPKDMILKWAEIADSEIERKREQYNVQ